MTKPTYKYIFEDTLTGVKLAAIPMYGVNLKLYCNTWGQSSNYGTFTGTFRADTPGYNVQELLDATVPGRTNVWVERSGALIWGGIVTTRTYQSESYTYQIDASTWDSQMQGQFLIADQAPASSDPRTLIINLWHTIQSNPATNYRVVVPSVPSGQNPLYSYGWTGTDYDAYSDQIASAVQGGAEYRFIYYYNSSGVRTAELQLGRWDQSATGFTLGSPPTMQSTTLKYPGAISNFWYSESGPQGATVVLGIGAAQDTSTPRDVLTNSTALAQGWPAYALKLNLTDVVDQTTLDHVLTQALQQFAPPFVTPTFKLNGSDSVYGTFSLGDFVHIVITDKYRFPAPAYPNNAFVTDIRVVGIQLSPTTDTTVEQSDFTVDQPSITG